MPLKAGARRMLGVLAAFHPRPVSRRQLGVLSRMTAGGGTFDRYLSTLRSAGLVRDLPDKRLELTDAGAAKIEGTKQEPPEGEELVALYRNRLKAGARRMVDVLVERRGRWTSRDHLAKLAGLSRGGTFDRYLSSMRSLDLVEERGGELQISEDLWWRAGR
ncbi:MAG TPA: hypothetical protein DCY40_05040 [Actinobacteria bacterium]|nr:hypothetical protein [Actinomycetota bacterium]